MFDLSEEECSGVLFRAFSIPLESFSGPALRLSSSSFGLTTRIRTLPVTCFSIKAAFDQRKDISLTKDVFRYGRNQEIFVL